MREKTLDEHRAQAVFGRKRNSNSKPSDQRVRAVSRGHTLDEKISYDPALEMRRGRSVVKVG